MQKAPVEHSAELLTCIKLHVFTTFVLSISEWPLRTGFTFQGGSDPLFTPMELHIHHIGTKDGINDPTS